MALPVYQLAICYYLMTIIQTNFAFTNKTPQVGWLCNELDGQVERANIYNHDDVMTPTRFSHYCLDISGCIFWDYLKKKYREISRVHCTDPFHQWPMDSPHPMRVLVLLIKQSSCYWFEKPWRSCNTFVMACKNRSVILKLCDFEIHVFVEFRFLCKFMIRKR